MSHWKDAVIKNHLDIDNAIRISSKRYNAITSTEFIEATGGVITIIGDPRNQLDIYSNNLSSYSNYKTDYIKNMSNSLKIYKNGNQDFDILSNSIIDNKIGMYHYNLERLVEYNDSNIFNNIENISAIELILNDDKTSKIVIGNYKAKKPNGLPEGHGFYGDRFIEINNEHALISSRTWQGYIDYRTDYINEIELTNKDGIKINSDQRISLKSYDDVNNNVEISLNSSHYQTAIGDTNTGPNIRIYSSDLIGLYSNRLALKSKIILDNNIYGSELPTTNLYDGRLFFKLLE